MANPWDVSQILLSNQSGANIARGIDIAGQSLGRGIERFGERREMNNRFIGKAKALEGFIRANAADMGADPKAILEIDPRETPAARYERLSGMVENTVLQKKLNEAKQLQQMREQELASNRFLQTQRETNAAALRNAFVSPTAEAIQSGATFGQLGRVPATRSMADAARRFIAAGGTPDSATAQFFNAGLDAETMQQKIAAAQANQGGFGTYEDAVNAAKAAGADSYTVQQTSDGRFIIATNTKKTAADDGEPIGARSVVETDAQGKPVIFYTKGPDKKWRLVNNRKGSGPALIIGYPGMQPQEE